MLGVMKIKWSLEENGFKGKDADGKLRKIVDKVMAIDADHLHKMMHSQFEEEGWNKK